LKHSEKKLLLHDFYNQPNKARMQEFCSDLTFLKINVHAFLQQRKNIELKTILTICSIAFLFKLHVTFVLIKT